MTLEQNLSDRTAVIDVINQLFIQTDNRDWEKVKRCFADKVIFDMTSMAGGEPAELTPQQIVDAWDEGLAELHGIHHQAGNFVVCLNGDEADVFCYGIAIHYLPNNTNKNTRTFIGSYDFHLIREQSWRIDRFKFNLKFIDGNPDLVKS